MKCKSTISRIYFLLFILVVSISCKKEAVIHKDQITGYVQKGPFINGTTILLYELNSSHNQTGKAFNTQMNSNTGSFMISNATL
jgi:hypothetical protein